MKILKRKTLLWFYLISLVVLAIIPINSGKFSMNDIYIVSFRLDYLAHSIVFLPWMMFYLGMPIFVFKKPIPLLGWIFFGLSYAALTEGIQFFLSYRSFNINDLIANALGIALSILLYTFIKIFGLRLINKV